MLTGTPSHNVARRPGMTRLSLRGFWHDPLMTHVLLTGFEPFGSSRVNPSERIVTAIASLGASETGLQISTAVLPVVFGEASRRVCELIDNAEPDIVLALGQAEGRSELSLERIAINLDDARIPDNSGAVVTDARVTDDGPAALFTSLPVKNMVEAIRAAGIPAGLSLSAGSFVCNHVFYAMQHHLQGRRVSSGFMHVPLLPEQAAEFPDKPTMDLDAMVSGVLIALTTAAARLPA
jgi:pyroglutamyl-peptidase